MRSFVRDWQNKTDEELIALLREQQTEGDLQAAPDREQIMDFLLEKYKNLVRKKANALFLLGGDTDDLIQEGMIGLFKAIRDYDPAGGSSFYSFAGLCITRQMYKAVEAAARKKHSPLNTYISLSGNEEPDGDVVQLESALQIEGNPEHILVHQEQMEQLLDQMQEALSPMEGQVLNLYLSGNNYHQIAKILDKPEKSIDNALQRIRQKVKKLNL